MRANPPSISADWTRRAFVRGAAGVLALPHLPYALAARREPSFAYVACGVGSVAVLSLKGSQWVPIQQVQSASPACLVYAPAQRMLYVANDVGLHEGLPRGTVEAFRIHPVAGTLTLVSRNPLSLSATHPRHMALSPDGKWLAVAAYGGGICNVLPVAEDGSLGAPRGIFKAMGSGAHTVLQASAHPHTLLFDQGGKHLLCSDFGSDRINVFAFEDGRLTRTAQRALAPGSGPGACVLHPAGFLYAAHSLGQGIGCYRYDGASGAISEAFDELAFSAVSLGLHPSGYALYASNAETGTVQVWLVDARSGRPSLAQSFSLGHAGRMHIFPSHEGQSVYLLDEEAGSLRHATADRTTGQLSAPRYVASLAAPRGFALHAV